VNLLDDSEYRKLLLELIAWLEDRSLVTAYFNRN
jgi:hypothetical protein